MLKTKVLNKISGDKGEELATNFIKKKLRYKILERNYKNKIGEIDIIALDKKTIVFVEVKYSSSSTFGLPRERVDYFKQQKIRKVASVYLKENGRLDSITRFDVIDIIDEKIEHIPNAF